MNTDEPKVRALFDDVSRRLSAILGSDDAGKTAAHIIFEDVAGWNRVRIFTDGDHTITAGCAQRIEDVVKQIADGKPVQYAVGHARFMGNDYLVNESVLIPRPETAALVDAVVDRYSGQSDLRILDIGTGSGCIAVSLAKALPFAQVTAVDISDRALDVAAENARRLGAKVDFRKMDILTAEAPAEPCCDIVVSNPPYIMEKEKAQMDSRVTDYEPASALFVPDNDPLMFYRAIGRYAIKALVPKGRLFFEINALMASQTVELLRAVGFDDVESARDYRGLERYVYAVKPAD